ncbi:protein kinase [Streptomyces sp. NPDC026672]|uniref:protein kinase n=1 Tax=unclassified Streptomyces TaxID=2593676 RepID=UPI0033E8F7E5
MDDYAGRVLADRYRLPLPPSDEYELTETRAFDTYSGQEVLVRQVPLPEVVEAEVLDADGLPDGFTARDRGARRPAAGRAATRRPTDPAVRRAVEAAQAAARIPDHPRLDQVFDVFAEGGSLWIVSEWVAARPLSAMLGEQPLTPYRAAEVASDVLTALRVLHAHGWVHRNITARTVLVCDDGRVMLTGLAVGAAEEALSGYDPIPAQDGPVGTGNPSAPVHTGPSEDGPDGQVGGARPHAGQGGAPGGRGAGASGTGGHGGSGFGQGAPGGAGRGGPGGPSGSAGPGGPGAGGHGGYGHGGARGDGGGVGGPGGPVGGARAAVGPGEGPRGGAGSGPVTGGGAGLGAGGVVDAEAARRAAIQARAAGGLPAAGTGGSGTAGGPGTPARPALETGEDIRAARAGAIAAYRAGARAAARVQEAQNARAALPGARPPAEEATGDTRGTGPSGPPGQIADPYGVRGATPWHGAAPRTPDGQALTPVPPSASVPPPGPRNPALPVQANRAAGEAPAGSAGAPGPGQWDAPAPGAGRGPATALAAERARQVRMTVVGPVTERWAPEQAGPVHENWQLAAPIGPATDLWALGALLFRAVQGHAPYPEESTAELVQLVCAEPPAFAEECGPLRPVVESLLRQDPTERPEFEELRGWLRSLVRSAPEAEAGAHVVAAPPDPRRLPIVRRRGELVRRRRAGLPANSPHGRHKRGRPEEKSPRSLGRTLLVLILLLLAGAIAYAVLFLPKADSGTGGVDRTGATGEVSPAPAPSRTGGEEPPDKGPAPSSAPSAETQTTTDPSVADGFTLRKDPEGFQVAVARGWDRSPKNGRGQVVYTHGDFELIVVPGRDGTAANGSDPMVYQRDRERELQPYRDSSWATATGLRTIEVGDRTMAEGQFTWTDDQGRDLFVRNIAILVEGRYHVLQVRGPEAERDEVTRLYEQAQATYRYTG